MQCQFELWEECNSRCKFCYLGNNNIHTEDSVKIQNIRNVIDKISDRGFLKNDEIDCLAFIGGEFFQGQMDNPEVKSEFLRMMGIVNGYLEDGTINQVWISATLTIGDQKDMYDTLKCFKDLSKVWILTSYDTIGRFHTEKMKQDWLDNLARLREYSKDVKINITSILTGDFIDRYIDGTLDLYQISEKYDCAIFLKPTCSTNRLKEGTDNKEQTNEKIPNFFPTREKFLQFLMKYKAQEESFMYDKLFNMKFRSDYLYKYSNGFKKSHRIKDKFQEDMDGETDVLPCGHSSQYKIYVHDDKHCAVCDKEMIRKMV